MQEQRWTGEEVITQNATRKQFLAAMKNPMNAMVAAHNCPPVGSIIAGREVTTENQPHLYLAPKGVWRWRDLE